MISSLDPPPLPPSTAGTDPAGDVPPATLARRPRRGAREVSSRYLSTPKPSPARLTNSNPSPRRVRTPSSHRSRSECGGSDTEESESADENRVPTATPGSRSSKDKETFYFTSQRVMNSSRKVVHKLFDERSDPGSCLRDDSRRIPADSRRRPRPGTPISPSLARNPIRQKQSLTPKRFESESAVQNGTLCESPPINLKNRAGNSTDLRSSLPGADSAARNPNPLVCRSLNSSLSGSDFLKGETKRRVSTEKPPLPPPGLKTGTDVKKAAKKGKKSEEDIHSLKLLNNRFLQLRFLNAKAEVADNNRKKYMERDLHGASIGILNCRERIQEKKIQLERLKREIMLSSVLEFQNPYLEDWEKIEEDQSECLSGVIRALKNASIRVPVGSDVKVNTGEIKSVLDDAAKLLEPSSFCLQNYVPKAEELENIASDLTKVTSKENELIEECGNLLAFARDLQLKESSLRSMLIQKRGQNKQAFE